MGKTSIESRWNLPGKIGWVLMEAPGFINLLYIMFTLPTQNGVKALPAENWLMAGLFVSNDGPSSQLWASCKFAPWRYEKLWTGCVPLGYFSLIRDEIR